MPDSATVVSLVPMDIDEMKYGVYPGIFKIKKSDGQTPQLLKVDQSIYYQYVGEGRGEYGEIQGKPTRSYIMREINANTMAQSIVNDFLDGQISRTPGLAEPGIFWLPGNVILPTILDKFSNLVKDALERQHNWFVALVTDADDGWEKHRQHKLITDTQRMAAIQLKMDRPWLLKLKQESDKVRCFACRVEIMKDSIICPNCKAVLDLEKYKTVQFAKGA